MAVTGYIDLSEVVEGDEVHCEAWATVEKVLAPPMGGRVGVNFVGRRALEVVRRGERRVPIRRLGRREHMPLLYATAADEPTQPRLPPLCPAALSLRGVHHWCDMPTDENGRHDGRDHANTKEWAFWSGPAT